MPLWSRLCWQSRSASDGVTSFVVQKVLAILCRAKSTYVTEGLREMLLAFEATGHGYIHYSLIGGAQYLFGTRYSLTQEKSTRGLAR